MMKLINNNFFYGLFLIFFLWMCVGLIKWCYYSNINDNNNNNNNNNSNNNNNRNL